MFLLCLIIRTLFIILKIKKLLTNFRKSDIIDERKGRLKTKG
jgi:hypothetical protein